jgi:hypothetical protein
MLIAEAEVEAEGRLLVWLSCPQALSQLAQAAEAVETDSSRWKQPDRVSKPLHGLLRLL